MEHRFSTPEKYQESVKSYYRLITGLDGAVKRIVDELVKKGLEKNTVIIFSSDNGYALGIMAWKAGGSAKMNPYGCQLLFTMGEARRISIIMIRSC